MLCAEENRSDMREIEQRGAVCTESLLTSRHTENDSTARLLPTAASDFVLACNMDMAGHVCRALKYGPLQMLHAPRVGVECIMRSN